MKNQHRIISRSMFEQMRGFPWTAAPICLVGIQGLLLAAGAWLNSPAMDEPAHLVSGINHWETERFELFKVNPPLVRMLAAVPVMLVGLSEDWSSYFEGVGARPEFSIADDFARANGPRLPWLITLARWAVIPLVLLGGWCCYLWARDLHGAAAGLMALALWSFCPNVLAYGGIITSDAGAAALGVAAGYLFWRWLRRPTWSGALAAGVALGLAELTKMTWILLFALWPALYLIRPRAKSNQSAPRSRGEHWLACWLKPARWQLLSALVTGLFVLNLGYGFDGSGARLRQFAFVSYALKGDSLARWAPGNRFTSSWLGDLPLPLPRKYVEGLDWQWHDIELGKPSYLNGHWKDRGWWYWYLYALAVKVPLGTWGLCALAIAARFAGWWSISSGRCRTTSDDHGATSAAFGFRGSWRDELAVLAPGLALLLLVSSQTGFSRYVRYALPALPFLFVWIGGVASWAWPQADAARSVARVPLTFYGARLGAWCVKSWRAIVVGGLLAWSTGSCLWYSPHWMSYFNELGGGPRGGPAHLIDAQVDWGQDLTSLKRWLEGHRDARPLGLVYFGPIDARLVDIDYTLPPPAHDVSEDRGAIAPVPRDLQPGWYAVSVNFLFGYPHFTEDGNGGRVFLNRPSYSYFRRFRPQAMAGYSIYIYRLSEADIQEAMRTNSSAHEAT